MDMAALNRLKWPVPDASGGARRQRPQSSTAFKDTMLFDPPNLSD
jgi:hypothetical protein